MNERGGHAPRGEDVRASRRPAGWRTACQLGRALILALSAALIPVAGAAQPAVYETEPNGTPAEATRVSGAAVIIGLMAARDQDGFLWTVSDVDAQKRWTFELEGIPGELTVVDVLRLEYAEDGVGVAGRTKLLTIGSRDGVKPALAQDLLFEPGEYLLGIAHAGGGVGYRPSIATASFGGEAGAAPASSSAAPGEQRPGGYRLTIREGTRLRLDPNPQVHGSREAARSLRPGSEHAAFTEEAAAWFTLALDDKEAAEHWEVAGQVPVGRTATLFLRDGAGKELSRANTDAHGQVAVRDLGLEAGTYLVEVQEGTGGMVLTVAARAVGTRVEGAEAEPNDVWGKANRADFSQPLTGRMGKRGESDYFSFALDEQTADTLLTLQLEAAPDTSLRFCLLDGSGQPLQCRDRKGRIELPDLLLAPGEYGLLVARGPESAAYTVNLAAAGEPTAGTEAEPNDSVALASAVPTNNRVKGRFNGAGDVDFYRVVVTEEPQLWRFQVIGEGVHEVAYHDGAGVQNQRVRAQKGQRRIRLENVFLLPGEHSVSVSGRSDGEYTLLALPIGPPDPNGEREPNDDTSRMQLLRFGQTRTGLLHEAADVDNYRFFLAAWDHIRVEVKPPADGAIDAQLYWDTSPFRQSVLPKAGQPLILEGLFPPGDYRLALSARKSSEAEYTLSLERRDRFACSADCEPNDDPAFATPVPPTLVVEGRVGDWRDSDWWVLPALEHQTEVVLSSPERRDLVLLASLDPGAPSLIEWDAAIKGYRGVIPTGTRAFLQVKPSARLEYRVELRFTEGPAPAAHGELPLTLAIEMEATEVGAYLPYGQTVGAHLELHHRGAAPLTVELDAATSDLRWRAHLERSTVTIPPGGRETVPLTLRVPPDAWADTRVRISARAGDASGSHVVAHAEVTAAGNTAPVSPVRAWPLPERLRGGFNAAWKVLGGRRVPDPKETSAGSIPKVGDGFDFLFDGMAVRQQGLTLRGGHGGLDVVPVTVELAGDQPLAVAGFAFTALGHTRARQYPRDVVLQLSLDGVAFDTVATVVLDPIPREQFVTLAEPREARFARVLLDTNWVGRSEGLLGLGEWKVIARPGLDVSGGKGFDLASPELGGHVVWAKPAIAAHWDKTMLTAKQDYSRVRGAAGGRMEWVVGFHHDRAARIDRLEWVDSPKASAQWRIPSVTLAISLESPIGPWTPIGSWTLPGGGGSGEFTLESPVWARYVKFSTPVFESSAPREAPDTLRIWEWPTGGDYRSILTEWGDGSQEATYEALRDVTIEKPLRATGHDSRPKAAPLAIGTAVSGDVQLGEIEHWYRIAVPAGHNAVTFTLGGEPTVRTEVHLESASGEPILLRRLGAMSTPREHQLEAIVEPGSTIFARVAEPPRNVLFLWDTSASVGPYLPAIYNSLLAYAEDLAPGRDAANFLPFGSARPLLRDWYGEPYIAQTVLNDYRREENSSEAEKTLHHAAKALAPRAGTKAIVMVTDAATTRYEVVWDTFAEVRPRIFGLGVSSEGAFGREPAHEQDLMQDWSRVNGGHYAQLLNEGEMEVAFDRVATLLRRPAPYTLSVSGDHREAPGPGRLTVISGAGGGSGAAIELILDASGSMLQRLGSKRRIEIAKEVLTGVIDERIPPGTPVALRVFGHREANSCRTDLEAPLAPLDPATVAKTIQGIGAMNLARTPIADSLAKVEADLQGARGRRIVVLVTDGEETCDGDPEKVIRTLRDKGFDITLNIVGFAIDDARLEGQFERWAALGGGRYFAARDQTGLNDALTAALRTPFTVYDRGGSRVGKGLVDGGPVELSPGVYRVVVDSSPTRTFDGVDLAGEQELRLDVSRSTNRR